jgi:hypothetical protein
MAKVRVLTLLLGALLLAEAALAARQPQDEQQQQIQLERKKRKPKHPYSSPYGLFIQVRGRGDQSSCCKPLTQLLVYVAGSLLCDPGGKVLLLLFIFKQLRALPPAS